MIKFRVSADSVPFHDLTLMYVEKHVAELSTPEDFLLKYLEVREQLQDYFFSEIDPPDEK